MSSRRSRSMFSDLQRQSVSFTNLPTTTTARFRPPPRPMLAALLFAVLVSVIAWQASTAEAASSPSRHDLTFQRYQICVNSSSRACSDYEAVCLNCTFNESCSYGLATTANCSVPETILCAGDRIFSRNLTCQYCYQSPEADYACSENTDCDAQIVDATYEAVCTMMDDVLCIGNRRFKKNVPCEWTSGIRWSTALLLSITVGGFGGDLFYLGYTGWGLCKLFTFGGLGVWTIVDVILIATGYLGPADGSLYL
ncbi:TM2 domain-containing protein 3 [Capsaspora owczarzaki ATCC 30864]|uniref:TM2 domain-containing protein 3 n=1 Tax=Capsaspora owczarzaki (strain ATCC 30864) TaxID=595528 RepID=A0A0D2UTL1_CAPO3|nr:TM2 domain-containing protein 3 [Capsaspora owczarzaki ATCC 30864]KJE98326.1 TM2 domain-containing protein 3 [Capsaspora owczarzaki ATCC 30864]|eukprot:XP_004341905.1 TM2 domain-containing protein 3 [Capsaspora owczarzaki ATCC 30864]